MDPQEFIEAEREYHHFGFSSKDVVIKVVEILNGTLENLVDSVLSKLDFSNPEDRLQLKKNVLQHFNEAVTRNIPNLERIIKEYTKIPENVLLPGEEDQYTPEYEQSLRDEIKNSENEIRAMERMGRRLGSFLAGVLQSKDQNDSLATYDSGLDMVQDDINDLTSTQRTLSTLVDYVSSTVSKLNLNEQ